MKTWNVTGLLLAATSLFAQTATIHTVAGNGQYGPPQDGAPAAESPVAFPNAVAADAAGNLFIAGLFGSVYQVTADGAIHVAASRPLTFDTICTLWTGIALDAAGRIYIADLGCNQIIRYDGDSKWTVVAGTGGRGFSGDGGPAAQARLDRPSGLAFDAAGNLYIADYGNLRVRKVNPDGNISTYAGDGSAASIRPSALAVDPVGNLYVADFPTAIRKILPDGTVTTLAVLSQDDPAVGLPLSLAAPSADLLYFGDLARVRSVDANGVHTIAGTTRLGFSGDGGPAADALLFGPQGLAVDSQGNVYVADSQNLRVRKIEFPR